MGILVNPDNLAFQVALNSEIYVDKSGLIKYTNKVLNTLQAYICNSRPRRFGKSITANMLTAYYSRGCNSEEMFAGLEISKSADFKKHLNQYDVIHLDIQWCIEPAGGPERVVSYISEKTIAELAEYYPGVLKEKTESLPEVLSRINGATGKKFIVIIDEWDVLIRDKDVNKRVQEEYINFLRAMFKGTEPTKYIQLAYLTGILPIKKEKTQSALNNFDEFTMLSASNLAPYIGFTEAEVKKLSEKYQQDFAEVKRWYDGYLLKDYQVYNPRAVVSVMLRGEFRSYWSETASYDVIVPLINMNYDGLKTAVIEMLSGAEVKVNVAAFQNDTEDIKSKDGVAVAEEIEKIHNEHVSVIQYNNENSLSSVLTIAYLSAMQYYFKPIREFPTGRGFADFVFIPKPEYKNDYPALLVELKWNQNAQTALTQIKTKKYPSSILNYTGDILLVGINYDKKSKEHQCLIEKYVKGENRGTGVV